MPETVRSQWTDYSTRIWQGMSNISQVQREETKQAFYAGAYSMLMTLRDQIGSDDVSDDEAVEVLENYKQELESFHREAIRRKTERN